MSATFAGVAPVFLIIAAGWAIRASGLLPRPAWAGINRLAYWVMFPAVLFTLLAEADLRQAEAARFLAAVALGFVVMGLLALSLRPMMRSVEGPAFSSLFQVCVRWNGFVVLAAAPFAFDAEGLALAALVFASAVPIVNVLSVWALTRWGEPGGRRDEALVWRMLQNPLIAASLAGAAWSLAGLPVGGPAFDALSLIGRGGMAVALLGVGAGLNLAALRARPGLVALGTGMKMLVMPLVMVGLAIAFGLSASATAVMAAIGASPSAAASYVLAREMGGDAELTAGYVTATTLFAALAMPLAIGLVLA